MQPAKSPIDINNGAHGSYFHRNNNGQFDVTNTDTASVLGPEYTFPVSPDGGLYTVTSLTHTKQDDINVAGLLDDSIQFNGSNLHD